MRSPWHLTVRIASYVRIVDKEAASLTLANSTSQATMPVGLSGLKAEETVQRWDQQDEHGCWSDRLSLRRETHGEFPMRGYAREVYSMDHH